MPLCALYRLLNFANSPLILCSSVPKGGSSCYLLDTQRNL
jgi:hypothetical protein